MRKAPVAVLISGRGSNMLALADAAADRAFPAEIALVLSDVADAPGIAAAAARGIAARAIPRTAHENRAAFEDALHDALEQAAVERVCLAGFMRILSADFVGRWPGRILNIHPSLLPSFRGLHTHRRALEAGVKLHGASVHEVVAELDAGPILAQAAVPVEARDTEDTLAARVLAAEHRLYPAALRRHITGEPPAPGTGALFHPP